MAATTQPDVGALAGVGDASSPSWMEKGSPMAAAAGRHCLTPPAPQGKEAGSRLTGSFGYITPS